MSNKTIYTQLIQAGMTPIGACALMGNMQAESNIGSTDVEKGRGFTDEAYTKGVDNGTYKNFVRDGVGYGLCQWTYYTRKQGLLDFAKSNCVSIGNEVMQTAYCIMELKNRYKTVWNTLISATDLYKATAKVCTDYERPAVNNIDTRYKYAKALYKELATVEVNKTPGDTNVYDVNRVIEVALAEVGYMEKRNLNSLDDKTANAGSNNYTKYARDLDKISGFYNGAKQGFAWCDVFVDWCFVQAYGVDGAKAMLCQPNNSCGAGCTYSLRYYLRNNQFFTKNPQVGDQIFFGSQANSTHTGLVVKVDNNIVYTVEGNTGEANGVIPNGGCVCQKSYAINNPAICGYGRPAYTKRTVSADTPTSKPSDSEVQKVEPKNVLIGLDVLQKGAKGAQVKAMQMLLDGYGFSTSADGDFGEQTKSKVMEFQSGRNVEADGIVGEETWTKLLKG